MKLQSYDPSEKKTEANSVVCGVQDIPRYFTLMYCSLCDKKGNIEGNGVKGKCRRFSNLEESLK